MATQFVPAPPAAISRVLAAFDRSQLASFIEVAIGLLDLADGDPDDDTGGTEDEPLTGAALTDQKPGCEISDPDLCVEHASGSGVAGDQSYAEWTSLPTNRRRAGAIDGMQLPTSALYADEDDEDDDVAEACGDEHDTGNAEDEELTELARRYARPGPGCDVADPIEPWDQPPTMDGPMPANDRGPE